MSDNRKSRFPKKDDAFIRLTAHFKLKKTTERRPYFLVKNGKCRETKEKVIIKYWNKAEMIRANCQDIYQEEIQAMTNCQHQNICRLREVVESSDAIFMVLEYCNQVPVKDLNIKKLPYIQVRNDLVVRLRFFQIVLAVEYLHKQGRAHRNLNEQSIRWGEDNLDANDHIKQVKLVNFDYSVQCDNFQSPMRLSKKPAESRYLPPELRGTTERDEYPEKTDMWGLGMILYTWYCGDRPPFINVWIHDKDLMPYEPLDDADLPVHPLCKLLLQHDPTKRPSIEEIWKHPYFTLLHPK